MTLGSTVDTDETLGPRFMQTYRMWMPMLHVGWRGGLRKSDVQIVGGGVWRDAVNAETTEIHDDVA